MTARGRHHQAKREQAAAMIQVLERGDFATIEGLRDDPLSVLRTWPGIQLILAPESSAGSGCSIAGRYDDETDPPTLVVGTSRSYRRRGFTALHEFGHHLQRTNVELGQTLFAGLDSEGLEETACDEFASRVLLPDDLVAESIGTAGPAASDVVDLFVRSQASREACCVRAANMLNGAGAVLLLDDTGTVLFAAPRGLVPPARGSDQSKTPLIEAALRQRTSAQRDKTFVTYRNGDTSEYLYGQAAWCDDHEYLIAVVASDNVPWMPLALPRPGTRRSRYGTWWTCETPGCGETFKIMKPPCQRCDQPSCGHGHCGCTAVRTQRDRECTACRLTLPPRCFEGTSPICRDCV
ncbi:ImmA/IrrE family metallo-endopeptidase [Labedaea rhizosphaerae]|uniref:Uncharacterized protein DUF955 n=1 Tax=Labedaea rhizosphaerae TaxID=598644 RepID=A0A4R6SEK3_LABRH|nr:ImmA/IrrE family metallo-endopeptidase [Labedaea rhizosphaerae]TDP98154.1 uncharacterized protein DUF955 [Labedaea rhizosphaerae]